MKIQNENTLKACMQSGINLFLGSGFSVEAKGTYRGAPKPLPAGDGLRKELLERFNRDKNAKFNLAQLCQMISRTDKDALDAFLRERFMVIDFDKAYLNIERANIKSIFTTNIDDLIFKIFENSQKFYINDISIRGPAISGSSAIDYIALHGSVTHPSRYGLDFSPVEISSSFERDKDKWYGYVGRIQKTPTLYWGYTISDAGVLQALSKETHGGKEIAPAWITLRKEDDEAIEYYTSLGFQIIIADTAELLEYFGNIKGATRPKEQKKLIDRRFTEYKIPDVSRVPVRQLAEFYLGADPSWYDIFLGQLHKTEHFASASDVIAGGKSCILVGAAVTGKTTLLKQLANSESQTKQVLYIDEISPEKAKMLRRDIEAEGVEPIIFVDNAADAWQALEILAKSKNIIIVAAERDYIYDSVAHRFSKTHYKLIDVSSLSPADVQSVKNKIPDGLQRQQNHKQLDNLLRVEVDPTFFEVLDTSVFGHSLAERFVEALKSLKAESPEKHDLLLLSCYLYACRVPTSVDVATSFLGKRIDGAEAAYLLLSDMNTLLSPYEGALAEEQQSYFVPRSRSVSETVMRKVSAQDLRALLENFHADVSTTKIPRYDVFRRAAYDANLTTRAFPHWEDGLAFYERCFSRDSSHSFKQQGALYLLRKKRYPLAFKWIDEAKSLAGGHGASVRNTYAVILFNANFDKPSHLSDVISTLDESMRILAQCYKDDLRKVYHAKVFAHQAVRYAEKYNRSRQSIDYIDTASKWLNNELNTRPGDRSINQLLRSLRSAKKMVRA